MFLHIGEDVMVAEKEIIMMLPWEKERQRKSNITFLKECEKKQPVFCVCNEPSQIKSLIVTDGALYLSGISVQTLKKRNEKNIYD